MIYIVKRLFLYNVQFNLEMKITFFACNIMHTLWILIFIFKRSHSVFVKWLKNNVKVLFIAI